MKSPHLSKLLVLLSTTLCAWVNPPPTFKTTGISQIPLSNVWGQNHLAAIGDINGDGKDDVIMGGVNYQNYMAKSPLKIYLNTGNGFVDGTSNLITMGPLEFYQPQGTIADLNQDGINDFIIFDLGIKTRAIDGGYLGGSPLIFLSQPQVGNNPITHKYSLALRVAIENYRMSHYTPRNCPGGLRYYSPPLNNPGSCQVWPGGSQNDLDNVPNDTLHSKFQSVADVDRDGYLDIFAEGGGAFAGQPYGIFFMGGPGGVYTIDDSRIPDTLLHGPILPNGPNGPNGLGTWRHSHNHFADMNNDGYPDLILGKLANVYSAINPDHDILFTKILYNDGSGYFPTAIELPNPLHFEQGPMQQATVVYAIATVDLNNDGLLDIALSHSRGTDASALNSTPWTGTGRYIQIFKQTQLDVFEDRSDLISRQDDFIRIDLGPDFCPDASFAALFSKNINYPKQMRFIDVDQDGDLDLVMEKIEGSFHASYGPLMYLWDGGQFHPYTPPVTQWPNHYYFTGMGLGFVDFAWGPGYDFVNGGPFQGTASALQHGLYHFLQL